MGNMAGVGDVRAAGILNGNQLAPSIINEAANDVALVVVDAGDIALQIAQIVVIRAVVQLEAAHAACVVGEAQRVGAVGLLYQRTAHIGVFRCGASRNFLGAQAAFVVLVADIQAVAGDALELAAFLPAVGIAVVAQRVSAVSVLVIADGVSVVGCQLVLPVVVAVAVEGEILAVLQTWESLFQLSFCHNPSNSKSRLQSVVFVLLNNN